MSVLIHPTAHVPSSVVVRGNGELAVGEYANIEDGVVLDTGARAGRITVGSRAKIKYGSVLRAHGNSIKIGHRVSIGEYCILAGHGSLAIGEYVIVGPFTMLNAAEHIVEGADPYRFQGETAKGIRIERNVWLGCRTTVLDSVTIEEGAIVGAHSLVLDSLPRNAIAYGSPARVHGINVAVRRRT